MFRTIVENNAHRPARQEINAVTFGLGRLYLLIFLCLTIVPMSNVWGRAASGQRLTLSVNPYAGVDWADVTPCKANLHTHSTESDGRLSPGQVIDEYKARGYQALALTDHNRSTWPWTAFGRDPSSVQMLAIAANELSRHHHTLSLFSNYETPGSDLEVSLAGVAKAGGLAILCHPAMHWVPWYAQASGLGVSLTPTLAGITEGDFTVETWFRTQDSGRNVLMGNYSGGYKGALNLELHTNNRVRIYVQPVSGKTVDLSISGEILGIDTRDGQWHHLAGMRCQGDVLLYLDGRLVGKQADQAGSYALQGKTYYFGRDSRTGSTTLNGDLCQARLWRRALSQQEMTALVSGDIVSTNGLLAQYASPTAKGDTSERPYPDTAHSTEGPFDAQVVGIAPQAILDGPKVLRSGSTNVAALRFTPAPFPTTVSDQALDWYLDQYRRHPQLVAIEVLNRTRPDREIPLDRQLWDGLLTNLMPDRPVWGAAVDDMHSMQHMGGDWVVLLADELNQRTAKDALATGCYYFASTRVYGSEADVEGTPRIERITHDAAKGRITITATVSGNPVPDQACIWIADGKIVHTGPTMSYRSVPGIATYVRAEITGNGGTAFTNPFGFVTLMKKWTNEQ